MVRNRHNNYVQANHIWYETKMKCTNYTYGTKMIYMVQITYGTKWFKPMVRNGKCMVRNCEIWYEMHMVRNGYGTKRLDTGFSRYLGVIKCEASILFVDYIICACASWSELCFWVFRLVVLYFFLSNDIIFYFPPFLLCHVVFAIFSWAKGNHSRRFV